MSIFGKAFELVKKVIAGLVGPSAGSVALTVLQALPLLLREARELAGADKFDRIRKAWEFFDDQTGLTGLELVPSMPRDAEERLFDGVKAAGLELSLWAAGYYSADGVPPSDGELVAVSEALMAAAGGPGLFTKVRDAVESEAAAGPAVPASPGPLVGPFSGYRDLVRTQLENPSASTLTTKVETLQRVILELLP